MYLYQHIYNVITNKLTIKSIGYLDFTLWFPTRYTVGLLCSSKQSLSRNFTLYILYGNKIASRTRLSPRFALRVQRSSIIACAWGKPGYEASSILAFAVVQLSISVGQVASRLGLEKWNNCGFKVSARRVS